LGKTHLIMVFVSLGFLDNDLWMSYPIQIGADHHLGRL